MASPGRKAAAGTWGPLNMMKDSVAIRGVVEVQAGQMARVLCSPPHPFISYRWDNKLVFLGQG